MNFLGRVNNGLGPGPWVAVASDPENTMLATTMAVAGYQSQGCLLCAQFVLLLRYPMFPQCNTV